MSKQLYALFFRECIIKGVNVDYFTFAEAYSTSVGERALSRWMVCNYNDVEFINLLVISKSKH